jgi:hypothetical protein
MAEIQTERQKALARELIENTKRAKPLNKSEILENIGYSRTTARHAQEDIISRPGVQKEILPVVERLKKHRDKIIQELEIKQLDEVKYKDLMDGMDKITKNIELLSGNATERTEEILTKEQLDVLLNRGTKENSSGRKA